MNTTNDYLCKAQKVFSDFEATGTAYSLGSIAHIAQTIRDHLAKAGVDVSALDPTGSSTAEEMESRIERAVAKAHLVSGRRELSDFEATDTAYSLGSIAHIAQTIRDHFNAGVDAQVFDVSEINGDKIEARIEHATHRAMKLSGHL